MLKKSFNAFGIRNANNQIDIPSFEKDNNITVPPLFKLFISYFEWEKGPIRDFLEINRVIDNDNLKIRIVVAHPVFSFKPYYDLSTFLSLKEGIDAMERAYPKNSSVFSKKYLMVGSVDPSHLCVMIGTNQDDLDNIFLETDELDDDDNPIFEKIADNIFELVHSIYYEVDEDTFSSFELSQIYKKWDDDKWYVREDVKDFMTLTEKRRMERKNHPEKFD